MKGPDEDVTVLLVQWAQGEASALDRLMPLVYRELKKLAKRSLRFHYQGHTLQTTDLVHEAFMKLAGASDPAWQNRHHFYAVAAKAMRQVLIDHARTSLASKRGGQAQRVTLDEEPTVPTDTDELLALNDALNDLSKLDPRKGQAVELRYFGGLSVEEAALALRVSPETVARDLRFAKSWLRRVLGP
jgi:RNA polymerase sigma factor (TIGR02999 family)